jgi:F420-dependent oxidoreductase-like protein
MEDRRVQIAITLANEPSFPDSASRVAELEKAGLDFVWVAENSGFDAPSHLGYLAANTDRVQIGSGIMPIYTRTPSLIAMTAAGVDHVSGGRFHLGLGAGGLRIIEGWHGVSFESYLGRTREIVAICRQAWARESPLIHDGRHYQLPLPPGRGAGLGQPRQMIDPPVRSRIPIWLAAIGEQSVALTAEIADGWFPLLVIPEKVKDVWGASLAAGQGKRDPSLGPLQMTAGGILAIGEGDEVLQLRDVARPTAALFIGGMGPKGRNHYNSLVRQYGYEAEAELVQDLYLSGQIDQAAAAIPAEFLELTSLVGPASWIAERLAAYEEAGVTQIQVTPVPFGDQTQAELIGRLKELVE